MSTDVAERATEAQVKLLVRLKAATEQEARAMTKAAAALLLDRVLLEKRMRARWYRV